MSTVLQQKVIFTERARAELLSEPIELAPEADELAAETLVSVISSGSESGGFMDYFGGNTYPCPTGYAAVMKLTQVGSACSGFAPGDIVFAEAPHQRYQVVKAERALHVPGGMLPEHAVLCRFPAVSMSSMIQTGIRPTEPVLVAGLGIVGLMCAQMMRHCGYDVYAIDPAPTRRETAAGCGIEHTWASVNELSHMSGQIGLALECSGNDQATLGLIPMLRRGGELALIGVPWRQTSDVSAHEIFRQVFLNYVQLRSGWEWSLPRQSSDFLPNSTKHSFETAMRWIGQGALKVDGIYRLHCPQDCNTLYTAIAQGKLQTTCAMFDWRK